MWSHNTHEVKMTKFYKISMQISTNNVFLLGNKAFYLPLTIFMPIILDSYSILSVQEFKERFPACQLGLIYYV